MKSIILSFVAIWLFPGLFAQNSITDILTEIEKNNTTLSALRKGADAELIGNRTGIYLQNPEVAFNYLWGSPDAIGKRTDLNISQTFDFPTAYVYRNQIADYRNAQTELEYEKQRKSILYHTKLICTDLIYNNALKAQLSRRVLNTQSIAEAYKLKFEKGDANILEYNRAQLNFITLSKDLESNEADRNLLLSELAGLNGGKTLDFKDTLLLSENISSDFEKWYAQSEQNNPVLKWLKQEAAISQKQVDLSMASSLPKMQGGYMSEKVVGMQYQGVSFGISVPLWQDKNTIKYAKAKMIAVQSIESDTKIRFYNELRGLHSKAISLQNSVNDYRKSLLMINSEVLLKKSFDKGQLSVSEYFIELSFYYESAYQLLELERDLNKTLAELNKYN
jgi:outer membrane protein, heavy metal efflux system